MDYPRSHDTGRPGPEIVAKIEPLIPGRKLAYHTYYAANPGPCLVAVMRGLLRIPSADVVESHRLI